MGLSREVEGLGLHPILVPFLSDWRGGGRKSGSFARWIGSDHERIKLNSLPKAVARIYGIKTILP